MGLGTLSELRVALLGVLLASVAAWAMYEHHHLIAEGKALELATLKASSDKLLAKAQQDIKDQTAQHAADVAANQVKLDAQLKANAVLSASLDNRVRAFDTYRRQHADVPRASGGSGPESQGECGTRRCADLAVQLAEFGDELARSDGELSANLQSCQRDRDLLTGLPR